MVAAETKAEINTKLEDSEDEAIKPPKKKAQLEGKENKVNPKPKLRKGDPRTKRNQVGIMLFGEHSVCVKCGVCARVCVMWCMC